VKNVEAILRLQLSIANAMEDGYEEMERDEMGTEESQAKPLALYCEFGTFSGAGFAGFREVLRMGVEYGTLGIT
jgi:hypothetical protein